MGKQCMYSGPILWDTACSYTYLCTCEGYMSPTGTKSKETSAVLLQLGLIGSLLYDSTTYIYTFFSIYKLYNCSVVESYKTILYLVSLLFAPPILHPTNNFLDREVFYLLVSLNFFLRSPSGFLSSADSNWFRLYTTVLLKPKHFLVHTC